MMPNARRKTDLNYKRGRSGAPLEKAKAECYRTETHCRKCGREVDKTLPYKDPQTGRVNRWAKSFGHAIELDAGGHPYRGHLEHVHCNSSAGATYGNKKRAKQNARTSQPLSYSPHSDDLSVPETL